MRIVYYPDPVLNKKCRPITDEELAAGKVDDLDLRELVERMKATMYEAEGIGLAAPQVGIPIRLFIVDVSENRDEAFELINPILSDPEERIEEEEGCLSIPDVRAKVKRDRIIKVTAKNLDGEDVSFEAEDLLSRVCQHENDHLDGILFIQHIGTAARFMLRNRLKGLEEDYEILKRRRERKK